MSTDSYHIPVMVEEVLHYLGELEGVFVDATLGGGGYSEALLSRSDKISVIGFDTDPNAVDFASRRLNQFGDRFRVVSGNFGILSASLETLGIASIQGIMYDLGISSHQIDTASIGLSYRVEAPLDMRLDPSLPVSAMSLVNDLAEADLRQILYTFGEEPQARSIVHRIVSARSRKRIETTTELAEIVGSGIRPDKRNATLSRVFQAIRISVNNELENLQRSLDEAIELLSIDARVVVVAYHSLEDRIVKSTFQRESSPAADPSSAMALRTSVDTEKVRLRPLTRKPILPSAEEIERNPRARSAKLRAAQKV